MTTIRLGLKHAVCLDGQNACPPEDVDGVPGCAMFLRAIANPTNEEYGTRLLSQGFPFDPDLFDLAATNAALQRLR
jgi:hypothetical protein